MFSNFSSAPLSLLVWSFAASAAYTDHPQVQSSSGEIIGHRAPNRTETFEFLGIKYGQAPIGDLRFAAPQLYTASNGTVYNASTWNADCPANIPAVTKFPNFTGNGFAVYNQFTAHNNNTQAEDCLALNIWTKSPASITLSGRPVFVFFHGGRFTIPGPHSPFYNGQYFADTEDVVVVTVNYRLGIFGFSGAPGLTQNAALLDQGLAVEWVRDNIAGFGGDASRINVFGQSAGAGSVDYWAYAYSHDPVVAGLISHSGTAFSYVPNNMSYARSLFYNVSGTLGCGDETTGAAEAVACVRSRDVSSILAAARVVPELPSDALPQAAFHPTVDNVTVFPLEAYTAWAQAGNFARIPYLAGNGDYEAGFYRVSAYAANRTLTPEKWVLFNQRAFTCPHKYAADARVAAGVPTWRYRYMGDWPNLRLYGAYDGYPGSGAYHGSDMSMLFGTAYDITGTPNSSEEELTSRYIMGAWAAFGRDPTQGLSAYGWPSYMANTSSLALLGLGNQSTPTFTSPEVYDSDCPPLAQNNALPGRGAF
ncbi:cholinesterase precursor [Xylariaceae sp. FL0016]|nr:cholinesterase precursor [Xylariaceae sp. FL0016]